MKIIDAIWFTTAGSPQPIGIVTVETEVGIRKAYIGTGDGFDEEADAKNIAEYGARFHKSIGQRLGKELHE